MISIKVYRQFFIILYIICAYTVKQRTKRPVRTSASALGGAAPQRIAGRPWRPAAALRRQPGQRRFVQHAPDQRVARVGLGVGGRLQNGSRQYDVLFGKHWFLYMF